MKWHSVIIDTNCPFWNVPLWSPGSSHESSDPTHLIPKIMPGWHAQAGIQTHSVSSVRQQTGTNIHECVWERKLFWVSLCIAAGSGALKLLNDRTRPSLSGRRWAMHACHLYTAVSFIWSSSLSLVAPHPNMCHPTLPSLHLAACPFATAAAFTDKDQSDHQFTDKHTKHINTASLCSLAALYPACNAWTDMVFEVGVVWGAFSLSAPNAQWETGCRCSVAGVNCC